MVSRLSIELFDYQAYQQTRFLFRRSFSLQQIPTTFNRRSVWKLSDSAATPTTASSVLPRFENRRNLEMNFIAFHVWRTAVGVVF
jgi:hypothetical protein